MKILVLAGGDSNERAVSLDSGAAICQALERLGHQVQAVDPASGQALICADGQLGPAESVSSDIVRVTQEESTTVLTSVIATDYADVELVFVGLHGGGGENGSIQNLLDLTGKRYTGSGRTASAVAMDKAMSKRIMSSVEVPTPRWKLLRVGEDDEFELWSDGVADEFGMPLIVKPNDGGSTIGLTKVDAKAGLTEALRLAAAQSDEILVEAFVVGRELTVSVLDGKAYPIVEIKPLSGLYDYEAKYTKGKSEYIAPAIVDSDLAGKMQRAAVQIYDAIGCVGLARVDFVLDECDRFFCLELNTLPGMTALSLAPMALGCEGIGFDQLISMIIDSALRK